MDIRYIKISPITLQWSGWYLWDKIKLDVRSNIEGIIIPNSACVYEVKSTDKDEYLTIGKASNLRMRIRQGLVKGKSPHSSGERIRELEETARIMIRWAITDRPAAVEEELHRQYKEQFGSLPKYTIRT